MRDDLPYWMALYGVPGISPAEFHRLVSHFGTPERVLTDATEESLAGVSGVKPAVARGVLKAKSWVERAAKAADRLLRKGVRILRAHEVGFPVPLKEIPDAPPLIYMLGEWQEIDQRAVAIVGTTDPSPRGREIALEFGRRFARLGCTVVSGYAHGIDSAGHRGALDAGGRTIFVVPTGIDRFKPRWGYPPLEVICQRGAVISEQPPGAKWSGQAAIRRNRLIVGLSRSVLVVETGLKGGTMNTVSVAQRWGRPVFVVKYREWPASARGNQFLLARGAEPISTYAEIASIMGTIG